MFIKKYIYFVLRHKMKQDILHVLEFYMLVFFQLTGSNVINYFFRLSENRLFLKLSGIYFVLLQLNEAQWKQIRFP